LPLCIVNYPSGIVNNQAKILIFIPDDTQAAGTLALLAAGGNLAGQVGLLSGG
jgi:hypothetical protein